MRLGTPVHDGFNLSGFQIKNNRISWGHINKNLILIRGDALFAELFSQLL